jgi:transcriptional regulator with XRE-family HTH domain
MAGRRTQLALRRKAVGLSQEQLAERLGVDRSTVVRWERGETLPQPWLRPKIARALQVSVAHLGDLLDDEHALDEQATERFERVTAHPASVDLVTVACLRRQIAQLDARYDQVPSASLLPEAGQCLGQVSFLAGHARGGQVRRALHLAEAEAATLMGQLVWDASQRRDCATAITCLDRAIIAARQAGDQVAEGRALLRKSFVALYGHKNPHDGLALASQAAQATGSVSHVLTGLAVLHRRAGRSHRPSSMAISRSRSSAKPRSTRRQRPSGRPSISSKSTVAAAGSPSSSARLGSYAPGKTSPPCGIPMTGC